MEFTFTLRPPKGGDSLGLGSGNAMNNSWECRCDQFPESDGFASYSHSPSLAAKECASKIAFIVHDQALRFADGLIYDGLKRRAEKQ